MVFKTVSLALAAALLAASAAAEPSGPTGSDSVASDAAPTPKRHKTVRKAPAKPAAAITATALPAPPKPPPAKPVAVQSPVAAAAAPRPAPGVVVGPPAPLTDWRPLDAENSLVIDTDKGRIIIELRPEFAPLAVARLKRLARSGVYDGLLFHRVVDGFMAQTGNPDNRDGGKSREPDLAPEFVFRLGAETPHAQVARPQGESEGFIGAQPYVAVDEARMALSPDHRVSAWGAYCPGVLGLGHGDDPASGNSEFFIMRAATRTLDRNYAVAGRVVVGLDVVRALAVGDPPAQPSRMLHVRVLADLPEAQRPQVMALNTLGPQFRALADQVRATRGADFSICDLEAPGRVASPPAAAAKPARKPRRVLSRQRSDAEAG